MAVPVSAGLFDKFDWNQRAGEGAPSTDAIVTDATSGLAANWQQSGSFQSDPASGYIVRALGVGSPAANPLTSLGHFGSEPCAVATSSYTFEADVLVTANLPDTWDTDHRVFVGVISAVGYSTGVLLAKKGLALATYPGDPNPRPLGGTAQYLYDEVTGAPVPCTVRLVINGTDGRVAAYVGRTAEVYDRAGSTSWLTEPNIEQKHNLPALKSLVTLPAGLYVSATAPTPAYLKAKYPQDPNPTGYDINVVLQSLRLGASALTPNVRPVAAIAGVRQALCGCAVQLYGDSSSDKYGAKLTYDWTIEHAPSTSKALLQGATYAAWDTAVDPAAPAAPYVATTGDVIFTYRTASNVGNGYTVTLVKPTTANASLSITLQNKIVTVSLATSGTGAATTTAAQLVAAFADPFTVGHNPSVTAILDCDLSLPSATGDGVVKTGTFPLKNGTGSALSRPLFVGQEAGVYLFSLVVDNGVRKSLKTFHPVLATATDALIGHRPNMDFVFRHISDFWNIVEGREQLPAAWGAAAQVVSAELLSAWQNDFGKSIRDISRKYQRQWLSFPAQHAVSVTGVVVVVPPTARTVSVQATVPTAGTETKTAALSWTGNVAPLSTGPHLWRGPDRGPAVVRLGSVTQLGSTWSAGEVDGALPVAVVLASGTSGRFVEDTGSGTTPPKSRIFESLTHAFLAVDVSTSTDYLRFVRNGPTYTAKVNTVAPNALPGTILVGLSGTTIDPVPVDGTLVNWELLRVADGATLAAEAYLEFPAGDTVAEGLAEVRVADLVSLSVADPYTSGQLDLQVPVTGVGSRWLFVAWTPLLQALEAQALAVLGKAEAWALDRLGELVIQVLGVYRTGQFAAVEDLVQVPRLGTTTEQSLFEGLDYTVSDGRVAMKPLWSGTAAVTAGSKHVFVAEPQVHVDVDFTLPFAELEALGFSHLYVETGPDAGVYAIVDKTAEGELVIAQNLTWSGTAKVSVPRYGRLAPPPSRLWAEVSFFDNWRNIENSFGLFVGLPKSAFEDLPTVDYLSAVKGAVVAFVGGPSVANLEYLANSFAAQPVTEHAGQVIAIVEADANQDGRIVYRDAYAREVAYRYPVGAVLAVNPTTGRAIQPFPYTVDPSVLSAADKAVYDDSVLPAYSSLLEWSQVDDYVSNPALIEDVLTGQDIIKKYHTFVVDVPLSQVGTAGILPLLKTLLQEAKPAHTNFILYGSLDLLDDLDLIETLTLEVTQKLNDTPHTPPVSYPFAGVALPDLWPTGGVLSQGWATSDARERYESGQQDGFLDDWSGDGSWNLVRKKVDQVNQLSGDDIDVLNSYVWVPVAIDATTDTEFVLGEELEILENGAVYSNAGNPWLTSPPVVAHVGSGTHPHLPFGVRSPQILHPTTYLLVGFEREQTLSSTVTPADVKANYATEARLDGIKVCDDLMAGALSLRGKTSGAKATPSTIVDRANAAHAKYFILRSMFEVDRPWDLNPRVTCEVGLYTYVPAGGTTVGAFRSYSKSFDPDQGANPNWHQLAKRYEKQLQRHPYDSAAADNSQFVPSYGPGVYADWQGVVLGVTKLTWGWLDVGDVSAVPTDLNMFQQAAGTTTLENVHVGFRVRSWPRKHLTHGFLMHTIPSPEIQLVKLTDANTKVRIEGFYFIDVDPTMIGIPTATPSSFDGTKIGAWVFFRQTGTANETAGASFSFETGLNPGKTVLGVDGAVQTSTGHILSVTIPALPADGYYDVVVRHYAKYKDSAAGADKYYVWTSVAEKAITRTAPGAYGATAWGVDPFGGP